MRTSTAFAFIPLAAIALCWTLPAAAGEKPARKPGRTEIGRAPWSPQTRPDDKVVYGTDDRRDVFEETDPNRLAWAKSTCALVDASALTEAEDGSYALTVAGYRVFGLPACDGEPYGNQPTAAYCTGFVVGRDLIATAGHCFSEADLPAARFLFGFHMLDATTPKTTFDAAEVYSGVEIVARQLEGDFDYAIIRVDRPITAPGAQLLPLRSAGTIPSGTRVGLIGHPYGLPAKIAFGDATTVRASDNAGYFVANLDAFGGNSGSPVFNTETGVVEGILVRGEEDFDLEDTCFRSRVLPDNGGTGEEISKAQTFAGFVQSGRGTISLDQSAYQCADALELMLFDGDLQDAGTAEATLFSSGGDFETIHLDESGQFGAFSASITLAAGPPVDEDGILQALEGETIVATYRDDDTGNGAPGDSVATARVDCTAPAITEVTVAHTGGNRARIAFTTNEPATGMVLAGLDCATPDQVAEGDLTTSHLIEVQSLAAATGYFFRVAATDPAGNATADDNGGACFTFTTTDQRDYLTQGLFDGTSGLTGLSMTFTPDDSPSGYSACVSPADGFPTSPFCGVAITPGDDGHVEYMLEGDRTVTYFGAEYPSFFVGANGYVTFGEGDDRYDPTFESHFALPRISGYFSDLYPPAGGQVSVAERDDRVAVTWYNVLDYYSDLQSFQIEMFNDGTIRITWIVMTFPYGIVGLSDGSGLDPDFEESNMGGYPECMSSPYEDIECIVDVPNDACDSAISAIVGQTYTGVTHTTMGSSDVPGCAYCYDPDVWYTFTPATSDTYTLSLCGSGFDTILDLFTGDCEGLEFIMSNDDGNCGYQSTIVTQLTARETYRIRISGYGATTGDYAFEVTRGAKSGFGCSIGNEAPGNPLTEVLILACVAVVLACRTRERRA